MLPCTYSKSPRDGEKTRVARDWLARPRSLVHRPANVEKWYEVLLTAARGASADSRHQLAYAEAGGLSRKGEHALRRHVAVEWAAEGGAEVGRAALGLDHAPFAPQPGDGAQHAHLVGGARAAAALGPGQDHTAMAQLSERLAGEILGGNK